jgi:transposase
LSRQGKTPQNSSLPPSTQHPHAKPVKAQAKSKKKQGGQPRHPRSERSLIPIERCDEVISLKPTACRRWGTKLTGEDCEPLRHQVYELPEIEPIVTEYQQHRLNCSRCGESTCAPLRIGLPRGGSGLKLIAFVALLMACFRQSKRRTSLLVTSILKIARSAWLTVKRQAIATRALRPRLQ